VVGDWQLTPIAALLCISETLCVSEKQTAAPKGPL
jgi:hypothetical protein